ncbi:MAG: ATP-binding protein [Betaproteobacteria bacterium]
MTDEDRDKLLRRLQEGERSLHQGDVKRAQDGLVDAARQLTRRAQELDASLQARHKALADELWQRAAQLAAPLRRAPYPPGEAQPGGGALGIAAAQAAGADGQPARDSTGPNPAVPRYLLDTPPSGLDDLTGADELKGALRSRFVLPLRDPARAALYRQRSAGGALLYGPPGSGKTFAVRALARELGVPTFLISPSEVVSKWLGDSEKRLAELFRQARAHPVSLMFIDEIDALAGTRDGGADAGGAMQRLLTQLLTELDGFGQNPGCVVFIGATNRPWAVEPALLRPGRIDTLIHVRLPSTAERAQLLARYLDGVPMEPDLALDRAAAWLDGCSAAETAGCANAAARFAFEDALRTGHNRPVRTDDLRRATIGVHRASSTESLARYERFARDHGVPPPAETLPGGPDIQPALGETGVPAPLRQVRAADLKAEIELLPFVCYALQHVGIHLVRSIRLRNEGREASQNLVVEVALLPEDYGAPWTVNIAELATGAEWSADNVSLPLRLERLRAVAERELGHLRLTVRDEDEVLFARTVEVPVLAYNEWLRLPEFLELTAAFVQPNSPALTPVVQAAAGRLEAATGSRSFTGYQSGDPARVLHMLEALHAALVHDHPLDYIDPPPSFEGTGQKVRLVAQTLDQRRGTCFDLAVLQAALWEHIGLAPCLVLVPGHAMLGCWTEPARPAAAVTNLADDGDPAQRLRSAVAEGRLRLFNSVEVAAREALADAERAAAAIVERTLAAGGAVQVIDVAACRDRIKPLP